MLNFTQDFDGNLYLRGVNLGTGLERLDNTYQDLYLDADEVVSSTSSVYAKPATKAKPVHLLRRLCNLPGISKASYTSGVVIINTTSNFSKTKKRLSSLKGYEVTGVKRLTIYTEEDKYKVKLVYLSKSLSRKTKSRARKLTRGRKDALKPGTV